MDKKGDGPGDPIPIKSLLVVVSYHHMNTEKVAVAIARVLDAQICTPQQVRVEDLRQYDLIGLGSGIYSERHHEDILDLADRLPHVADGRAFIFSTYGTPWDPNTDARTHDSAHIFHTPLRERLQSKGYMIVDEFDCPGLNTNGFLRYFGGLNKGRPNAADLKLAEEFAEHLKQKARRSS